MHRLPDATQLYINGQWIASDSGQVAQVINPATEGVVGKVALGNSNDSDKAVLAARAAFTSFSQWSVADRISLLKAINAKLIERNDEIGFAVNQAMGAPMALAMGAQAKSGTQHFTEIIRVLENYDFEERLGSTMIRREPIGVCVLISPWNWPVNQVAAKVAPALAAGCTMVLKPSEYTPFDSVILAEICDEVGVPEGVFNLVHGDGLGIGVPLCEHEEVDMISFTGSTRAGSSIAESAAKDIKRVALELGGKSACIFLDDADFAVAVPASVRGVMLNSGQSCNASSRLLVPASRYSEVCQIAAETANALSVGPDGDVGPVANSKQFASIRRHIQVGIDEGARLIAGGPDRPHDLEVGYFIAPTVFADVEPGMAIEREEIFGPVVTLMLYRTLDEAIAIANTSDYGLSGAVWAHDQARAYAIASQLRTGMVHLNGAGLDPAAPFGGYKKSGNGREWGVHGLEEFLELKSVYGAG